MSRSAGVIGLGLMGGAMARRLIDEGFEVHGYDTDAATVERAAADGIRTAASVPELCESVDAVLTSLPDPAAVRGVWLGPDGVARHARPGSCLLEVSTIGPVTMREVAAAVPEGVAVLDAPVSGGPVEARAGTLTFIAGGREEDLAQAGDVIRALSRQVHHAGDLGTGKVVKLVNNIMSMTNILVAAEAFAIGEAAGMDPRRLFEILSTSGGASSQFLKRFPYALDDDYAPRFSTTLSVKDLGLGAQLAHESGVPSPMTAAAREMYAMSAGLGHADEDMVALLKLYRDLTQPGG